MSELIVSPLDVRNMVRVWSARERELRMNTELSEEGKRKRFAIMQASKSDNEPVVKSLLVRSYRDLLKRFNDNDAARRRVQEEAASQWNYERLNYAARSATAAVRMARDVEEVSVLYEQAKRSGDKHTQRAFIEVAREAVSSKWPSRIESVSFMSQLKQDLTDLLSTSDLEEVDKRGAALAGEAMELRAIVEEALKFYHGNSGLIFGATDELGDILNAIRVKSHYEPELNRIANNVEVVSLEQAQAESRGFVTQSSE